MTPRSLLVLGVMLLSVNRGDQWLVNMEEDAKEDRIKAERSAGNIGGQSLLTGYDISERSLNAESRHLHNDVACQVKCTSGIERYYIKKPPQVYNCTVRLRWEYLFLPRTGCYSWLPLPMIGQFKPKYQYVIIMKGAKNQSTDVIFKWGPPYPRLKYEIQICKFTVSMVGSRRGKGFVGAGRYTEFWECPQIE